ncbi:MAG: GtrA family protein [Gracilibacteraceae bacterium]|jgi:putative flippase GtrA|nr:GtrA family protein [Gracilibacteraceae bacterium]
MNAKSQLSEMIRFGLVGVANTVVGYGVYLLGLKVLALAYPVAMGAGTVCGIINSYFWNKKFTFRSKNKYSLREMTKFISVYVVQYLFNISVIFVLTNYIGVSESVAGLFGILAGTMISYCGHKFWTFV